jgi:hypothetical protein
VSTEPAATYRKPLPAPTATSRPFWQAAREHRLVLQRSRRTGKHIFYPREVSPFGVTDELDWVEVSGRGIVHAFTIARRPTAGAWEGDAPYVIAIVALEEGPHMTTNIVGCAPEAVTVGMPVVAVFEDVTADITLVKFAPVPGDA